MSLQCVCSLMVLVMVVCCGYGLKVDRYNCTLPNSRNPVSAESVCIDTGVGSGRELRCASTSTKKPLLSDGDDTTSYIWVTSAFLSLAIPNNVCVGAIVMTFRNGSSLGIPSLTFELNEPVTTSHDGRPGDLVNTTITFTPQYCGQSVRINMERDGVNAIQLTEVTLIEGDGDDSVTETTVTTTTTTTTTTISTTTPTGCTSVPGATEEPQYALIGGLAGGGLVIVLLMVMLVVCCFVIYFLYRKLQNLSKTQGDENDYDYVTTHEETHTKKDIVLEDNPAYEHTREVVMKGKQASDITQDDVKEACI